MIDPSDREPGPAWAEAETVAAAIGVTWQHRRTAVFDDAGGLLGVLELLERRDATGRWTIAAAIDSIRSTRVARFPS